MNFKSRYTVILLSNVFKVLPFMKQYKYKKFETERLKIRPTTVDDARFIFELVNSPKWLKYIGDRKLYSEEDVAIFIKERIIPQLEDLGYSNYTIIRKSDGQKIGTCGLYNRNGLLGIDIGFAMLPQYEKQGYAYESVSKLLDVAINHFNIDNICAITTKENFASQNLLVKIGLEFEKNIRIPKDPEELMLYILKK